MTHYVLDTDILTLYQSGHTEVVSQVQNCSADRLALSVISVEEQLTGWYTKLRRAKKHDQLARAYQNLAYAVGFLSNLKILPFAEPTIARYEDLRGAHRQERSAHCGDCFGNISHADHQKPPGFSADSRSQNRGLVEMTERLKVGENQ